MVWLEMYRANLRTREPSRGVHAYVFRFFRARASDGFRFGFDLGVALGAAFGAAFGAVWASTVAFLNMHRTGYMSLKAFSS